MRRPLYARRAPPHRCRRKLSLRRVSNRRCRRARRSRRRRAGRHGTHGDAVRRESLAVVAQLQDLAVAGSDAFLQAGDFCIKSVEQAGAFAQGRLALSGVAAFAEKHFEDDARMRFGRQRGGGRRPGEIVLVDARISVVALTHGLQQVHRQLERRKLRLFPGLVGEDLIHRDADVEPGLARRRRDVREEARAGLRMRAAGSAISSPSTAGWPSCCSAGARSPRSLL